MKFIKRLKSPVSIALLVVLLSILSAGCGGGSDKDNKVPDQPAPLPDPSERF